MQVLRELSESLFKSALSSSASDEHGAGGTATGCADKRDGDMQVQESVANGGATLAAQQSAAIPAATLQVLRELSNNGSLRCTASGGAPGGEGATSSP